MSPFSFYRQSPAIDPVDPLAGGTRVLRGGAWDYIPNRCRSAFRSGYRPTERNHTFGFRVVLVK